MEKQRSQNEKLDDAGRNLLKAGGLSQDELERLMAAPKMFDGVKARIRAEQAAMNAAVPRKSERSLFAFLNWQYGAAAFASLLFVVLSAYGVFVYIEQKEADRVAINDPKPSPAKSVNENAPVPPPTTQQADNEDQYNEDHRDEEVVVDRPEDREIRKNVVAVQTSFKRPKRIQREIEYAEPVREFYPVSYTNGDDISSDIRIVRVELPRSSLFSMGFDAPIHNGAETVKAELLVSADGVTKGVRLVD